MRRMSKQKRNYLKLHEVATQLRVAPVTVRKYANEGKIEYFLTPSNQRVFTQEQVDRFLGVTPEMREPVKVFYTRASDGDKAKLTTQYNQLEEAYGVPQKTYTDKASGLNSKRKGLWALIKDAENQQYTHLYLTQQDRLARFGYEYLEHILTNNGVTITILGDNKDKTLQEEFLQDFMSLIASFSGKFYRLRGYEQQKQLLAKAGETLEAKSNTV